MFDMDTVLDARILLFAALALLLISLVVAANRPVSSEMARYPMEADVTDDITNISVGISVDANRIDFGELPARALSAEKSVSIRNNERRPVSVQVKTQGNLSQYIEIRPSSFSLAPGTGQEVRIRIQTRNGTIPGRYGGTVIVEEQFPLWRLLWKEY